MEGSTPIPEEFFAKVRRSLETRGCVTVELLQMLSARQLRKAPETLRRVEEFLASIGKRLRHDDESIAHRATLIFLSVDDLPIDYLKSLDPFSLHVYRWKQYGCKTVGDLFLEGDGVLLPLNDRLSRQDKDRLRRKLESN